MTGTRMAAITAVAVNIAGMKPMRSTRITSNGVSTAPPKLAPVKARLSASPRRATNHWLTTVAMTTEPMPTQPSDIKAKAK